MAFFVDEFRESLLVLRVAAKAVLKVFDFLSHAVAHSLHQVGGVKCTGMMDAVAYRVVVGCNEVGHVGSPLWVDVEHRHLHAKELRASHVHIAAVLFVEFEHLVRVVGAYAVMLQ